MKPKYTPAIKTAVCKCLNAIEAFDTGLTKVRIGNQEDGGYVALKEICDKTPQVYSFGVGDDTGFELDWVKRYPKAKIQLFDPYIVKLPQEHKRFTLHKVGLGVKCPPIKDVQQDSLLKMDIEWDEWGAFLIFPEAEVKKFSQILIEFHMIHVDPPSSLSPYFRQMYGDVMEKINNDLFTQYYDTFKWLQNWFVIHHIHANNSLPVVNLDGYWFPPLLEISWVRRDLLAKKPTPYKGRFPVAGLDLPNKSNRPDIFDYYPMGDNRRLYETV